MKGPFFAGILVVIIWGASPPATVLAAGSIPPELIGGLRSMLAVMLMLPAIFWFWGHFPSGARGRGELVVGGLSGFALFPFFASIGVAQTSISHSSLILAAAPIFTGLISFMLTKDWPRPSWWGGTAMSLAGVGLLFSGSANDAGTSNASLQGDVLVLLSMVLASIGYVFGSRTSERVGRWPATFWMLFIGALALSPFLLVPSINFDWSSVTIEAAAGLAFLVLGVTILGYALWFWALGAGNPEKIAPLQFAQPLVGIVLGLMFFGESITLIIIASGVLIISGVAISSRA